MQHSQLLTVKDLTQWLQLHPTTFYKLVGNGEIPFVRINGRIRFKREEIIEWINQGSNKQFHLAELLPKMDISLDRYDKMFLERRTELKGMITWSYPFGSVRMRKTKNEEERYYIDYQVDGNRVRKLLKGIRTRVEAVKVLNVEVADAQRSKYHFHKKNISFCDFAELYYEKYSKRNKRSHKSTDAVYLKHMKEFFGNIRLAKITPLMIEDYKIHRLKTGKGRREGEKVSNRTINAELSSLRKLFNKAIDWNYAVENPVKKVDFLSEKKSCRERVLSLDEERQLLAASPQWLRSILIVGIYTGIRKWKVLTLKWEHVDFEEREILVVDPKDDEDRKIPMNSIVYNTLADLRLKSGKSDYVFANPSTGTHYVEPKRAFKKACEEAGIEGLHFHDLRHSFASRLVANGNDLNTVKELMGHSKLTTTQRYLHSSAELKRDAVNSLFEQRHNFGIQCQNSDKKFPDEVEDNTVTSSYLAS